MTQWLRLSVLILLAPVLLGGGAKPQQAPSWTAEVAAALPAMLDSAGAVGLSVAVVDEGKVVYAGGFGFANRAARAPVSPDTIFNVASVSKPVATIGFLHLAEQRGSSLDEPLAPHLRSYRLDGDEAAQVTIRRVLQHRAGLSMPPAPWFYDGETVPTLAAMLNGDAPGIERLTLAYPVGAAFNYSGGGYALLQLMAEDLTGVSFDTYVRREIFQPLGMTRTRFARPDDGTADVATGYDDHGEPVRGYTIVGAAAGGLHSSAADLARFVGAYTRQSPAGRRFFSEQSFAQISWDTAPLQYPGVDPSVFGNARYGLGHGVHHTKDGATLLYHSGGNPGFMAYLIVDPDRGRGLVMLANSAHARAAIGEVRERWASDLGYDLPALY